MENKEYIHKFKQKHAFEKRKARAVAIRLKYPDRVPVIVEKSPNSTGCRTLKNNKILVPLNLKFGDFIMTIRKRITLDAREGLFVFVNNQIPSPTTLISQVYSNNHDRDGFLYVMYTTENVFG